MTTRYTQVSLDPPPPGGTGTSHFLYGGTLVTPFRQFVYNGRAIDVEEASTYVPQTCGIAAQDQVLSKLTWFGNGDNTTMLVITVNGGATYGITLTAVWGSMDITPIPLSAGDYVQISYVGGTAPGASTVLLT